MNLLWQNYFVILTNLFLQCSVFPNLFFCFSMISDCISTDNFTSVKIVYLYKHRQWPQAQLMPTLLLATIPTINFGHFLAVFDSVSNFAMETTGTPSSLFFSTKFMYAIYLYPWLFKPVSIYTLVTWVRENPREWQRGGEWRQVINKSLMQINCHGTQCYWPRPEKTGNVWKYNQEVQ